MWLYFSSGPWWPASYSWVASLFVSSYLTFDDFGSLHLAFILLRNIPVIFFIYFWFIFLGEF